MTIRRYLTLLGSGLLLLLVYPVYSQPLSFRSIGTSEGMHTLTSWHCTMDGFGHIWVSTSDGLMRYNGNEVNYYYSQTTPGLTSDQTGFLFCDSKNNMWICTPKGLTKADQNREMHRQIILPEERDRLVNFCIEDSRGYITAISEGKCFQQVVSGGQWISKPGLDSLIPKGRIRDIRPFDKDSYILTVLGRGVLIINFKTEKQIAFFPLTDVHHAIKVDDHSIVIARSGPFALYRAFLDHPDSFISIPAPVFFKPGDRKTQIEHLTLASDGRLYMATDGSGLLQYDLTHDSYVQYTHDPANPYSIADNALRSIISDTLGNIAFTSLSGVNFANVRPKAVQYLNYFKTVNGEVFDGRVISIAEDTLHHLWVVMEDVVLIINISGGHAVKLTYPAHSPLAENSVSPYFAVADDAGYVWIAFRDKGIGIFNTNGKLMRLLSTGDYPGYGNSVNKVRIMSKGPDGYMYIGAENGLFRINLANLAIDTFPGDPAMLPLRRSRVVEIMPLNDELWVSTSPSGAAWNYTYASKQLKKYSTDNGLVSDRVYGLARDNNGNVYAGSYSGLNIIRSDGTVDRLVKGEGLPSTRIDAIEKAKDGTIWMTNIYNLLRYDPETKRSIKVSGQPGFSLVNFQMMASAVLSTGALAFGVQKGLVLVDTFFADPDADRFDVFVFYKNAAGHEFPCLPDHPIHLNSKEHLLRFSFGVNDLIMAEQIDYRYRLRTGTDTTWSEASHLSRVDFNLNSGSYVLEVQASDGNGWYSAPGPIEIKIDFPLWKRWWVISLLIFSAGLGFWIYFRGRIDAYKKELAVTRQIADLESKALRAQMNPHFVFNSLNAIQECIVTGKVEEAYTYLSKFSRLLRLVLEHSDLADVSLHEEIEVLSLYVALEKLRFKDDMSFTLSLAPDLDDEEIHIPPMLIQPHLENAIWHGLRHKEGKKILLLTIAEKTSGYLEVVIEDNGIGRAKSESLRQARLGDNRHKSKGTQLSVDRMDLLKKNYPITSLLITDLADENGVAAGTRVQLLIPILGENTSETKRV